MIKQFLAGASVAETKAIDEYFTKQLQTTSPFEADPSLLGTEEWLQTHCLNALIVAPDFGISNISIADKSLLELNRNLLQLRVLLRNVSDHRAAVIRQLISKTQKLATNHENFVALETVLKLKKYFIGFREGLAAYNKIDLQVKRAERLTFLYDRTLELYFISSKQRNSDKSEEANYNQLAQDLEEVRKAEEETGSKYIKYYMLLLEMELNERRNDFKKCLATGRQMRSLLLKAPFIANPIRFGFVYSNACLHYIKSGKMMKALEQSAKSKEYFDAGTFSLLNVLELEFTANFHLNNVTECFNILVDLDRSSITNAGQFKKDLYKYYRACLLFKERQFNECLKILSRRLEIEKDKNYYNIAVRILTIMCLIELCKLTAACAAVEALRKHVERKQSAGLVRPRLALISQAILQLERNNFEYSSKNKVLNKYVSDLKKDKNVAYDYASPELIPFHVWLRSKRK